MKKLLLPLVIILFLSLFIFLSHKAIYADTNSSLTISDAIYADLAVRNYLDDVSLYYSDNKKNTVVKLNETKHWIPASTIKTFTAMYAFKLISEKKLSLQDSVVIDAKNDVPTELVTDEMPTLLEGESVTIDRLIRQMITQSDNTAFNQLLDVLGRDNITHYIQSLGLTHSNVGSKLNLDTSQTQYEYDVPGYGINTTTAADYALAFQLIYRNKIPGAKQLFAILKQQKINNMIPLYLPKTVICAHKTGDLDPLFHDGGICQDSKQSYVLTIFTNAGDPNLVAHLSELVYTRNYNLVGAALTNPQVGQKPVPQPLDPLVMNHPKSAVLGASTANLFPVPEITAADLGVTAQDLSLVIQNNQLPKVIIPADSPLHFISDAIQISERSISLGGSGQLNTDLQTAQLRIAEAKDLADKGQTPQAIDLLQRVQQGLTVIAKNPELAQDPTAQNTVQAISETSFSVLSDELAKSKGAQRIAIIKTIADQARSTTQNVQPNIPDASNSTNLSQKPLVGEVVKTTPTDVQVLTAGGQQLTIPIQNNNVTVKEKQISEVTPLTELANQATQEAVLSPTPAPSLTSLKVGTTVALFGSSVNNTFAPSLVLTNVPQELGAPQPVTVVKVNTQNNTLVVNENGVYTQVDVSNNTKIQGADTNIPLNVIKSGDIVVVHGEPLVQTPAATIEPTSSPTVNPNSPTPTAANGAANGAANNVLTTPTSTVKLTITPSPSSMPSPSMKPNLSPTPTPAKNVTPTLTSKSPTPTTKPVATPTPAKSVVPTPTPVPTTTKIVAPTTTPQAIQSTSIQVVEKSSDVSLPPPVVKQTTPAAPAAPAAPKSNPPTPTPANKK
jgi:beta-lactamase class A